MGTSIDKAWLVPDGPKHYKTIQEKKRGQSGENSSYHRLQMTVEG
jgi:hypothetical protein